MKKILLPIITILLINFAAQAQSTKDTLKADPSLSGQYQFMLSKSRTLDDYKLVNPSRLSVFWKNVRDTLSIERKQLINAQKQISAQEKEISDLKTNISGAETSLATSNTKLNEISFLGIAFTKLNYNIIVWGLIIMLAVALTFVVLRSARHINESKYRSELYEEVSQEYQNYKVKANEKEKKLARELQDERNRLEEIRNR